MTNVVQLSIGDQRLLVLADYLDTVPGGEFDLAGWMFERESVDPDLEAVASDDMSFDRGVNVRKLTAQCGYAACAVGHACGIAAFQEQGLVMFAERRWERWSLYPVYTAPDMRQHEGWEAVREFFHINNGQSSYLFDDSSYGGDDAYDEDTGEKVEKVPPSVVAARIRSFVATREIVA